MGEKSNIEWTDSTFNPWIGCTRVSPACDHCYAEAYARRTGQGYLWDANNPRRRTRPANWRQPLAWNAEPFVECLACRRRSEKRACAGPSQERCPACAGEVRPARRRVFCASLADVFDNAVPPEWRFDLFALIRATPNLDWLLLTKRIGNARRMLDSAASAVVDDIPGGPSWCRDPWPNVWIGATVVNQAEADRDVPKLLEVPARVRFLSIEPMLGEIDLRRLHRGDLYYLDALTGVTNIMHDGGMPSMPDLPALDWVIAGGESGPQARPMHPAWVRRLRDQCDADAVPFLFKQWGEWRPPLEGEAYSTEKGGAQAIPAFIVAPDGAVHCYHSEATRGGAAMRRVGKKAAGRELDGRTWDDFPVVP